MNHLWESIQDDARNCKKVYRDTLLEILQSNKDTVFGSKNGFKDISTAEEFRSKLPLTEYVNYADLVGDMISGAQPNALTSQVPLFYACTSGTTGKPSVFPYVSRGSYPRKIRELQSALAYKAAGGNRSIFLGNCFEMNRFSSSGVAVGPLSTYLIVEMTKKVIEHGIETIIPPEVLLLTVSGDSNYLALLFVMQSDINLIVTQFITTAVNWLSFLRQHWGCLIRDIRNGCPGDDVLSNSPLTVQHLPSIKARLHPNPTRASELESLFPEGSKSMTGPWARQIWPSLRLVNSLAGSSLATYIPALLEMVGGDVIIYSGQHAGSEGFYGRNYWPGLHRSRYALLPRLLFMEFLPEEDLDANHPRTVEVDELKQGKRYEIVITTFAGLCRYRVGDVIEVQGEFEGSPTYDFIYRRGSMLNIFGEKTNEQQMADTLKQLCGEFCWELLNFTTAVDWNKDLDRPRYVVFVELSESSILPDGDKQVVYRRLQHLLELANPDYAIEVDVGRIGLLQLHVMRGGGFQPVKDLAVQAGTSPVQFKMPRLLKSDAQLAAVHSQVVW